MTSRTLKVVISGDASKAQAALRKLQGDADATSGRFAGLGQKISASMVSVGRTMTFGVTLPLIAMGTAAVASLGRIERLGAQTDAVIESTGGAANVTREQVVGLADELERMTSVESEVIQEGQNMLLTFTNISNKAGEGNDIFNQATEALVNMSTAMGTEPRAAAIQLGKALNDPIAGLSALTRVGIQFTDEQKNLIETLVASGDIMGAQKVILGELETQFGGVGEALGDTMQGRIANVGHAFGAMGEQLATALIPAIEGITGWLQNMLDRFQSLSPAQQDMIAKLVAIAAAIGPVLWLGGKLWAMFTLLAAHPVVLVLGAVAAGIVLIGSAARAHAAAVADFAGLVVELGDDISAMHIAEFLGAEDVANFAKAGISITDLAVAVRLAKTDAEAGQVAFQGFRDALRDTGGEVVWATRPVKGLIDKTLLLQQGAMDGAAALDEQTRATDLAANAALDSGSALDKYTGAIDANTTAVRRSADARLAAIDPVFALFDATRQHEDAVRAVTDAEEEYGRFSPQHVEALEAETGAFLRVKSAAREVDDVSLAAYGNEIGRSMDRTEDLASGVSVATQAIIDNIARINTAQLWDKTMTITTQYISTGSGSSYMAKGGPFSKGDVAVVGEEGPEVAVFGADGYLIPNDKLSPVGPGSSWGGGGSTQTIYVTVTGNVYGQRDLESVVVGAITAAQQRGRLAAPVGADTPPARPARPPT